MCISSLRVVRVSRRQDAHDGEWQLSWRHVAAGQASCLGVKGPAWFVG
jgi:hypothetical protein